MSGEALTVVACGHFRRDVVSPGHDLMRRFRAGDDDAFEAVLALVRDGLTRVGAAMASPDDEVLVVPMPGHRAGDDATTALQRLAEVLVAGRPGWRAGTRCLRRVADAPEGKQGGPRDAASEAGTLRWSDVLDGARVLLLDDVVRTGASLEAARLAAPPDLRARLIALVAFRAEP
ncbi:MAG TPA: hypothetical protein VIH37_14030 [Candidatus Limnocylindrales bacterium]